MMVLYSYLVGRARPIMRLLDALHDVPEELEHQLLLVPVRRLGPPGCVVRLIELVHHDGRGVREVQYRILLAGGDGDEDVAEVQLVLQEPDVLAPEEDGDPLRISAAVLRELANRDRDAGVVPVPLGGHAAGPHDQEASFEGLVQGVHDVHVVQKGRSVLRPAVGVVSQLAGVHEVQLAYVEVGHGAGDGPDVSLEFRSDDYDADIRHARVISIAYLRDGGRTRTRYTGGAQSSARGNS